MCGIAKDLIEDCEELLHHAATSAVVRETDKILAHVQQYVRLEQDTTPIVSCDMKIDFSKEDRLLESIELLGEIIAGELSVRMYSFTVSWAR